MPKSAEEPVSTGSFFIVYLSENKMTEKSKLLYNEIVINIFYYTKGT